MLGNVPLHRFEEFGPLTEREIEAVATLASAPVMLERHAPIRREGDPMTGFFLLLDGWVAASMTLPDGGRQILKVHLPGDVLGTPSMAADHAIENLIALTPITVCTVPLEKFGRLLEEHPRVAAYFLLSVQRERVALMDQLASIGRTSAEARLAALLLDLAERLAVIGEVEDDRYQLRLTQEQIGDLLGLTAVHVNRMLRVLEEQGLVARERQMLAIRDRRGLLRLAARPVRSRGCDLRWLPASR